MRSPTETTLQELVKRALKPNAKVADFERFAEFLPGLFRGCDFRNLGRERHSVHFSRGRLAWLVSRLARMDTDGISFHGATA